MGCNTLHDLTENIENISYNVSCPKGMKQKPHKAMGKTTSKQRINSKQKGAVGERELAQLLRNQGWMDARRGVQYSGLKGDADVVGIDGIHIECKRVQQVSDERWLEQAERDARIGEIPVVIYRRNHEDWKVLIRQSLADIIWQTLTGEQKDSIREKVKMNP